MRKKRWILAAGVGVLLLAVLIARQPAKEEKPARRTRAVGNARALVPGTVPKPVDAVEGPEKQPVLSAVEESSAPPAAGQEEPFWEGLGGLLADRPTSDPMLHRNTVLARTGDHLGLEGSARTAFAATAVSVVDEIAQAWAVREQLVLTLPAEREEEEAAIQGRYEEMKRQALERLEVLLGDSAPHCSFRSRLEEWVDTMR